jgi:hypothetical protein
MLGGALLALGVLLGLAMLVLPRSHKLRQGLIPVVPQVVASIGAGGLVWGWFLARRVKQVWEMTDTPPAPEMIRAFDRVSDWKDRLGLLLPVLLLLGLLLSALPIWRMGAKDTH